MATRTLIAMALGLLAGVMSLAFFDSDRASGQTASPTRFTQPGFSDTQVTDVENPTAIAFAPDGRMLVTNQQGRLYVYKNGDPGQPTPAPALDIRSKTCSFSERGLLGVALDPQFAGNGYVYIYHTFNRNGACVNRVTRFVLRGDNTIDLDSEKVLLTNIYSANNHNAGDLHFGKDGYLYVTVGDGGKPTSARSKSTLLGKVLRVDRAGYPAANNPYRGTDSTRCGMNGFTTSGKKCQEVFASGLRNPFRFAFDPNAVGTRFFINDVGQRRWEEINAGKAGADYGWDVREGPCVKDSTTNCGPAPAGMTNPLYWYGRGTGCTSITGAAFVPNNAWTSSFNGSYLFGDFVCGMIFKLTPNGSGGYRGSQFAYNLGGGSPAAMAFSPNKSLYYTSYGDSNGDNIAGEVHRISYTGS